MNIAPVSGRALASSETSGIYSAGPKYICSAGLKRVRAADL